MINPNFLVYYSFLYIIILVPLSALLLWLTTLIFKVKKAQYWKALIISLIVHGSNFLILYILNLFSKTAAAIFSIISLLLISFLLAWYSIIKVYKLDLGTATLVWLVWSAFKFALWLIFLMLSAIALFSAFTAFY